MFTVTEFEKIAAPVIAVILLAGMTAGPVLSSPSTDHRRSLTAVDTVDVEAYREAVARTEFESGAYAADLTEQLLGLGQALQQQNRHAEAVGVFKRGTHLARINDGLYSATQIPMIQGEITSHVALGEFLEADSRQQYMLKVQQRSLSNPESRTQALLAQAKWQHNAYRLRIGEQPYGRLMSMWDLYRGALTEIAGREGDTSMKLLSPLHGLLQTQYLISSHQISESSSSNSANSTFSAQQNLNRFHAYRARSYKQGYQVIQAIYEIENAQTAAEKLDAAEAQVMLGDWNLWHKAREPAAEAYQNALNELAALEDGEQHIERIFGKPVALPVIEGVQALPPLVPPEEADVLLQFGVTERGRVINLERLDENEENRGRANRLMRKLRATPFRPRFEDGQPMSTETVFHAYKIAN